MNYMADRNRRMRNRTYGGVGGGRSIPAPYPMQRRCGWAPQPAAVGSTAMHFSSIAIGVGSVLTPTVVRQASTPAKCSA